MVCLRGVFCLLTLFVGCSLWFTWILTDCLFTIIMFVAVGLLFFRVWVWLLFAVGWFVCCVLLVVFV